ncbi:MAG TPA: amino acid ABC transporter substrate-binding protein [Pseudolabrys sp.]|nr:amino acid ABC transporter substrate-binding protein [Pseudolabrys sp.]
MLRIFASLLAFFLAAAASAQTQIPPDSRLKTIAAAKTIKIAARPDAAPFSFLGPAKEQVGYSIDVCRLVVGSIQQQLGLDQLKIEWVPVTVDSRFSTVASGKADMECGSSTVTLGRMKEVDFSSFIFLETTGVVVSRASNIRGFADMTGKKIAAISGTTNQTAIAAQMKLHKVEAALVAVKDAGEGVAMLESGKADGYASDKLLLIGLHLKDPAQFTMLPDELSVEPYAIALPRGDWALRLAVNTGLAQIYRHGEIVGVFKKWFDQIGLQMSPALRITYGLGALAD